MPQAQLHYPSADLRSIPVYFDALAREFRARMAAAGVQCGVPALQLLSNFLFAECSQ